MKETDLILNKKHLAGNVLSISQYLLIFVSPLEMTYMFVINFPKSSDKFNNWYPITLFEWYDEDTPNNVKVVCMNQMIQFILMISHD